MKTPPDLQPGGVEVQMEPASELGRYAYLHISPQSLLEQFELPSVLRKKRGISLTAAQIGTTGLYLVDHSSLTRNGDLRVPLPYGSLRGKWVLHARKTILRHS